MLRIALIIALVIVNLALLAQCTTPPESFVLDTKEDYIEVEDLAIDLMECMIKNPTGLNEKEIEQAKAFCLVWLGGTPSMTVEVDTKIALFLDDNPEYLYFYIFSLALVENEFPEDVIIEKEEEAMHLLARYDELLSSKKKNKHLKKFEKLYQKNKLAQELEEIKKKCASSR